MHHFIVCKFSVNLQFMRLIPMNLSRNKDKPKDQTISKTVRSFEEKPDYGQQRMNTSTWRLILPIFFRGPCLLSFCFVFFL